MSELTDIIARHAKIHGYLHTLDRQELDAVQEQACLRCRRDSGLNVDGMDVTDLRCTPNSRPVDSMCPQLVDICEERMSHE
jgi:hypothetical protein